MAARKVWIAIGGVVLLFAIAGMLFALSIVRNEGWEGLWKRKRSFVESTHPEASPVLEKAEEKMKGEN